MKYVKISFLPIGKALVRGILSGLVPIKGDNKNER